jgi:hypothetical protein
MEQLRQSNALTHFMAFTTPARLHTHWSLAIPKTCGLAFFLPDVATMIDSFRLLYGEIVRWIVLRLHNYTAQIRPIMTWRQIFFNYQILQEINMAKNILCPLVSH